MNQKLSNDFYHFLAKRLMISGEKKGDRILIDTKSARRVMGYSRVPREMQECMLENLEKLELIKRKSKRLIEIVVEK